MIPPESLNTSFTELPLGFYEMYFEKHGQAVAQSQAQPRRPLAPTNNHCFLKIPTQAILRTSKQNSQSNI